MELDGGTGQLLAALIVETQSCSCDSIDASDTLIRELLKMLTDNTGINLLGGLLTGSCHVESAVKGHETGVHFVVTTTRG
jgi:hypothetical protein